MGLFDVLRGWFGGARRERDDEDAPGLEAVIDALEALRAPALRLEPGGRGFHRLGGLPSLPPGLDWPEWRGRPLAFLLQLDLATLPRVPGLPELPASGLLWWFYDAQQSTWGFDPEDRGSWRVLYAADATPADCAPAPPPEGLVPDELFEPVGLRPVPVASWPPEEAPEVQALDLTDAQLDAWAALREDDARVPLHQLGGHPAPIQHADMAMECQLASHGLYQGDDRHADHPLLPRLAPGADDWVLLLQLDSDDAAGMQWGDAGMLYIWIRRQDLAAGRFDAAWQLLQCH